MQFATDRFYKGTFNYRTCTNGPVEHAPRYSYESATRLYDVVDFPAPTGRAYCVNGRFNVPIDAVAGATFKAIVKHFNLGGQS